MFVENRLRHLLSTGEAVATVLAPSGWFPGRARPAPREEVRHAIRVLHPPWLAVPLVGMRVSPALLYRAAAPALQNLLDHGERFDAIDAHYFFPDGIAAIRLGQRFGLPVAITARGSDITQFPDYPIARRQILRAAGDADGLIAVSDGLRQAMARLGIAPERVHVLRNGVDLEMFRPQDRVQARRMIGVDGPTLVSVGALIERKGHALTIEALTLLPGWRLLIAGEGPERARLEALAGTLGVSDRVRLLGSVPHHDLATLYSAADLSVLASSREGWANVLLESMACGTPVVASPIAGNPEVVQRPEAGLIARDRSAEGIAEAVLALAAATPDRAATRRYAEGFSWDAVSAGQLELFRQIVSEYAQKKDRPRMRETGSL